MSCIADTEDETDGISKSKPKKDNMKRSALVSVLVYIMKQSYILSLIAMMVGATLHHRFGYNTVMFWLPNIFNIEFYMAIFL